MKTNKWLIYTLVLVIQVPQLLLWLQFSTVKNKLELTINLVVNNSE